MVIMARYLCIVLVIYGGDLEKDSIEIAHVSLAAGTEVNKTNKYGTPIHYTSHFKDLETVTILLAAGAEVKVTDNDGDTPLHLASYNGSYNGHLEVVNFLLAIGVEVNKTSNNGSTPLHLASYNGRFEVVKSLIQVKTDVRILNNQGKSPVDIARTNEIREFIHQYHPWQRRRSLILTRPHADHATNKAHKLIALGDIVTATEIGDAEAFGI